MVAFFFRSEVGRCDKHGGERLWVDNLIGVVEVFDAPCVCVDVVGFNCAEVCVEGIEGISSLLSDEMSEICLSGLSGCSRGEAGIGCIVI